MKYFDEFITEDESNQIEKLDCLYTKGIVSLDNKKTQEMLDCYVYELYLKASTEDEEGGDVNV